LIAPHTLTRRAMRGDLSRGAGEVRLAPPFPVMMNLLATLWNLQRSAPIDHLRGLDLQHGEGAFPVGEAGRRAW